MILGGIVLLVIAVAALLYARSQTRRREAMAATKTSSCGELDRLAAEASRTGGPGKFSQSCEVVGAARPAPGAAELKAPFSGQPAVWHRTRITHHYWERRRRRRADGSHDWDRQETSRVISDERSQAPFAVDDGTGQVLISPIEADIEGAEKSFSQFEPDDRSSEGAFSVFGIEVQLGSGSRSIGFEREEWVVRPGTRLYTLGEISDRGGRLQIGKPIDGGRLIISSRSEQELQAAAARRSKIATIGGAVAAVAGVALLVVGLLA